MKCAPAVVVLTPVPSPYQVELFNGVADAGDLRLQIVYMMRRHADRLWRLPDVSHEHVYGEDGAAALAAAQQLMDDADLVVFSWYADGVARRFMRRRARSGRPWVFWGERPGAGGWSWLGRLRRRVQLGSLHRCPVPIWGMGSWAVQAWREEFGGGRPYQVLPYFSDLQRFAPPPARNGRSGLRRFLFSGSLIARKGVDLLATAFASLVSARPQLRLDLAGAGELEPLLRDRLQGRRDQVRFLGFQQWRDLPACYHDADVLVAPSRYDGWGLIVPEGLAAGLPVIATDRMGAALDLITPGVNGWRIPAGDQTALTRALTEAAELPYHRLAEMSAAARQSVAEHSLAHGVRRFTDAARAALTED
jgi:hypothetical protein